MIQCWNCKLHKTSESFFISKIRKGGDGICKACLKIKRNLEAHKKWEKQWRDKYPEKRASREKKSKYKYRYGIAFETVEAMRVEQNNTCAICKRLPLGNRPLCVDHNHLTGRVRALLCDKCNSALGMVGDDITILQSMIDYLKHHDI